MRTVSYGALLYQRLEGDEIELLAGTEDEDAVTALSQHCERDLAMKGTKFPMRFRLVPLQSNKGRRNKPTKRRQHGNQARG